MDELTPADHKLLAVVMAYTALVKTLADAGVISMDPVFANLAGARARLEALGELDAADYLGELSESLTAI